MSRGIWLLLLCFTSLAAQPSEAQTPDRKSHAGVATGAQATAELKLNWTFDTGLKGSEQSGVIIAGDELLLMGSFPHSLIALDINGSQKWRAVPLSNTAGNALDCCVGGDHSPIETPTGLVSTTQDGHLFATDPLTGAILWDVELTDVQRAEGLGGPPALVNGRIFVGSSGDQFGLRGWIAAVEPKTGKEIWRRYTTGPDSDVGIVPTSRVAGMAPPPNSGVATWPPSAWETGGGSPSGAILYDPKLDLIFHGTGMPAPGNVDQREGRNYWTSGLFARDPESGDVRWFVQFNPNDPFGYGGVGPNLLVDHAWQGEPRKLLIHADANGVLYVIDRATGELLAADNYTRSNVIKKVDPGSGRTEFLLARIPHTNLEVRDICPAWTGAAAGNIAYSEKTGLLYIPSAGLCMDIEPRSANYIVGTPYTGVNYRARQSNEKPRGVTAWNIEARHAVWIADEALSVVGGVSVSNTGLVAYGTMDGWLKVLDGTSGKTVAVYEVATRIMSRPTWIEHTDGRNELIAVSGLAGPFAIALSPWIDQADATAAMGLAHAFADLQAPANLTTRVQSFTLP